MAWPGTLVWALSPLKCPLVSPLVVILGDDVLHLGLVLEHRLHVLLGLPHLLADKSVRKFFFVRRQQCQECFFVSRQKCQEFCLNGGFFEFFFFYVLHTTLLHLPPLRSHCIGGCWDRTQDCCDFGIGSQTLDLIHKWLSVRNWCGGQCCALRYSDYDGFFLIVRLPVYIQWAHKV